VEPAEPEPEEEEKMNEVVRCRAIKSNGLRCRHTSITTTITEGLCPFHARWRVMGRPLAPPP
jgi:hypothetical protein